MADVMVQMKIMPESPDVDRKVVQEQVSAAITEFGGEIGKVEEQPVAFGLVALNVYFIMDESKGDLEPLEVKLSEMDGVASATTVEVRRTLG